MDYPDSEEESSSCGERDGQEKVVTETDTAILDEEDKEDSGMAATGRANWLQNINKATNLAVKTGVGHLRQQGVQQPYGRSPP